MNERYGLTADNMLAVLPQVLQNDGEMLALATAVADTLSRRPAENDLLRIYAEIDRLPEGVLDILAYDFKVDWWDGDYTLEQKRQILKDSWRVHRMLGTKGAVEAAISPIYPETKVQEWYEYGGMPYFFKLQIDLTHVTANSDAHDRILSRVNYYKNLRSHLENIKYTIRPGETVTHIGGVIGRTATLSIPEVE